MGKCVIVNLSDYSERLTTMKCPFCGVEMKELKQEYPAKYNLKPLVTYDHSVTGKCKNGDGHTLSQDGWMERKQNVR